NGDGKDDLAVLYDSGQAADGKHVSTLFAFTSNGTAFAAPKQTWTSTGSFNWNVSLPTSGDYNNDGKDDLGVLYEGSPPPTGDASTHCSPSPAPPPAPRRRCSTGRAASSDRPVPHTREGGPDLMLSGRISSPKGMP
ncbi:hypothetical protein GTY62_36320, partial [Streptomyces sp. SID724]|uniref:FG-GAP-like repeat-containing protein n=1 Tax=Streptomyces sp. SID724 TaxID=2690324 RepID=UPI001361BB3F|nr:hypothetical protein [Streptomyces sp. SID724]